MPDPFDTLAGLANYLVSGVADLIDPLFGGAAGAAAIVLSTALLRLVLLPSAFAQRRADWRRTALVARIAELRSKHKGPRLEAELATLYRAEGPGLLRGLLPALVQLPFFAGMYRLFLSPTVHGHANTLLHQTLFGVPLGATVAAASAPQLVLFAVLLALLALAGYAAARLRRSGPRPTGVAGVIARVMPFTVVVAGLFLPLAASLYLVTTTAWTAAQTALLRT